jgi:hypothetical protein
MITTLTRAALALVLALLLALAIPSSQAAPPAAPAPVAPSYFPLFRAPPQAGTVTLVESDTTFVSAAYDPSTGRIFVSYIDRGNGNKAHLTELIQDRLYEVAPPTLAGTAPAFSPDSPKDADSALLAINGWLWWFVSSRDVDDPTGDFKLKLTRVQPKVQP